MKRMLITVAVLGVALAGFAGQTSTLTKTRIAKSADVVPGKWHAGFSKCKAYATEHKVPLIAVWSNGDACSHCVRFESACNSATFRNWMATSGCVFFFAYPGDGGDGKKESTAFHWCRKNVNTSYPFVRIWWPAGKVDVATVGDTVDGLADGTAGGKNAVSFIKSKIKKFNPIPPDPDLPYSIEFNANYPSVGGVAAEMAPTNVVWGETVVLPAVAFSCTNFAFSGWAKSATGTVAYKNAQSVQGLTLTSNAVIRLYARWTRTTYGPYYTGIKKTIKLKNYAGTLYANYKPASKIPGLTWSAKGYWTGKPTTAGTYAVKFTKGSSSITRTFVIVKDAVEIDGLEIGDDGRVETDTSELFENAVTAVSGELKSVKVTGLPDGLVYKDGVITGRVTVPGTYTVKITGVSVKNGQTVTRTVVLDVAEGNAILLNGLAHADEVWAVAGDVPDFSVALKVKHPDGTFTLEPAEDVTVLVQDAVTGEEAPAGTVSFEDGTLSVGSGVKGVFTVGLATTAGGQDLATVFELNVLEPASEPE